MARGPTPYIVQIRGVLYPSAEAAAKAFGISVGTVRNQVAKGNADRIGLGRGTNSPPNHRLPVVIGPVSFSSYKEAAEALGFKCPKAFARRLRSGKTEKIIAAAMRYVAERERKKK